MAVFNSPLRFFICSNTPGSSASGHFSGNEVAGANFSAHDGVERLANESRRMVERGLDADLGIVQRARDRFSLPCLRGQPPKRFTVPPLRTI